MAEPLTSSDIIREQMGFGPSSPDEKRRAAGAGISPLGTMERIRFEEGRGLSPMARKSEKEAYMASEVMAGRRDPMELPKSYGGLGERPEATTRRGFRMQQEWDKQYETMQAEQEAARRAERERLGYELQLRQENRMQTSQDLAMESARLKEEREARVQDEAKMIFDSIRGKTLPDGTVIPPLRPSDPNSLERVTNLMNMTYGMENQPAKEAVMMIYGDIVKSEQSRTSSSVQEKFASDMQKLMETGVTEEELPKYFDTSAPVGVQQFDPRKVAARLGTTKAQEKAETQSKKEETPTQKAEVALATAYGELNDLLLSGADTESASAKVAGLREGYKKVAGKDAPKILPQPTSPEQLARIPVGQDYIGLDGKTYIKRK